MESINQKQFEVSEIKISYAPTIKPSQRVKVLSSGDAAEILRTAWNSDTLELSEQFKIILLNRANRVLGIFDVSHGGITGTVADPKLIFGCALKAAASGIILAHYAKLYIRHTIILQGFSLPVQADIELTKKFGRRKDFGDNRSESYYYYQ